MKLLDLAGPYRLGAEITVIAFAVCVVGGGAAWVVHRERDIGRNEVRAKWASETLQRQAAAINAQQDAANETVRRLAAQQKVDHEHEIQLAAARADSAAAAGVAVRLRQRIARLAASGSGSGGNPAAADISTAAAGLGSVAGECVAAFAALADAARRGFIAGNDAAARYDSLNKPQLKEAP